MIRAVIFDVDGTLIDSRKANTIFFGDIFEKAGYVHPTEAETDKVFHLTQHSAIRELGKKLQEKEIENLTKIANGLSYRWELQKVHKHAQEVVKQLRGKYKLGIVTNRLSEDIDLFFKVFGLREFFDVVVGFEEVTNPKPSPDSLLLAAKKLNIPIREIVYVGDALTDLQTARGASTKFISYGKKPLPDGDAHITSFEDLPSAIKKLDLG